MLINDKYSNIIRSNKEIFTIKEYILYKKKYGTKDEIKICKIAVKAILQRCFKEVNIQEVLEKFNMKGDEDMLNCVEMIQKDIRQSLKSAREEGKLEIIKNMLREKISIDTIKTVSGMNEKDIEKIAKQMKCT